MLSPSGSCSGYLVALLLQWQSIPAAIKFMLNALAVTFLYYSMGVASRTATPTSVYMHDIALTESSKHTWIFFTVICGSGGEDGCHISQEGDEGERRKVKRKDEVRVGVRGGQKEKERRAWEE